MRPTGLVLIAVYHFLAAVFLVLLAVSLLAGGAVLAAMLGGDHNAPLEGLGFLVGVLGAIFMFCGAAIAAVAGYGIWKLREWGRILSIVLAALSLVFTLPGLLMMGLHLGFFFGGFRLIRIAIAILIIWYLVQPHVRALFQRGGPISKRHGVSHGRKLGPL
jgi:hypothetical protein